MLLPLVVAAIGWFGNVAFTRIFPDKEAAAATERQVQQIDILKNGFDTLVKTLTKSSQLSPEVTNTINFQLSQFAELAKITNKVTDKYKDLNTKQIDTSYNPLSLPKPEPVMQKAEQTITIAYDDKTSQRLNSYNQIAVIEDVEINGRAGIKVNQNNHVFIMYPADVRPMLGDDKKQVRLLYDGKIDNFYQFRFIKN